MARKGIIVFGFFIFAAFSSTIWAGGWNNTLLGCRAISIGGAFTGLADDPSAIFYNPAGLTFQRNSFNLSIDGFYIWPTFEYTLPTGAKIQSRYESPLPQIFVTYRTGERITVGFGAYVPYAGGGVDWKKEDLGFPLKSTLAVLSLTPTLAYQVSEKLSLGFNINFYKGIMDLNTEMTPYGPIKAEESGSTFSAGFGLMFRPSEKVSLGIDVRGPAKMNLTGTTKLAFGPYKINLDSETAFNLPWDVEIGFSYRFSERFLFSSSAQYTMWSALDKVEKKIKGIPLSGDLNMDEGMNFENILILRAGVEYFIPHGIFLRAGVGLDQSATPNETLNVANIDVDKFTLLGGIGYRSGKMQIDFAYVYGFGKEREKKITGLSLAPLTERYNLNVFILGIGLTFSF